MQGRDRNKGGIGRRLMKNQKKGDTLKPMSISNQPAFPAYERVVLREGEKFKIKKKLQKGQPFGFCALQT